MYQYDFSDTFTAAIVIFLLVTSVDSSVVCVVGLTTAAAAAATTELQRGYEGMRTTTFDDPVRIETAEQVKAYCNNHELTFDEFLAAAVTALEEADESRGKHGTI